ncbi:MAG: 30S ribosome-binding factor RbfA [Candidatus Nealsonbacteria bacterium]|nr:30S ribosome-binding factor RbfA [Candidatus Nealsonbacteria bacterium]
MAERIPRVNQLIRKELGKILHREVEFPEGVLVTITRVETSSNLIQTRVYISTMPEIKGGEVLAILRTALYNLQQKLNKKINMRPMPKIIFIEEQATVEAARVEELLDEMKDKND